MAGFDQVDDLGVLAQLLRPQATGDDHPIECFSRHAVDGGVGVADGVIFQAIFKPIQADHGYPGARFYEAQA